MAEAIPARRPYQGSCHCGFIRYVVFLRLPFQAPTSEADWKTGQSFYRCNCTICHKGGFFHIRLDSSPDDFALLSPLNPLEDLKDYMPSKDLHFLSCPTCATRSFVFMGQSEITEADLGEMGCRGSTETSEKTKVQVWRPKKEGWREGKTKYGCYLSVNAYTIDQGQDGFDLRQLTEENKITYIDYLKDEDRGTPRLKRPHPGGAY